MRAALIASVAAVLVAAAGCVLVTGSTDGYALVDSGSASCQSAHDCSAGNVCCLSTASSSAVAAITGACAASCSVSLPQLCAASSECGDAGACALQTCMPDGSPLSVTFHACGKVPGCTASP